MSRDAVTHRYWQIILVLFFILNSSSLLHLSVLPRTLQCNEYLHNLRKAEASATVHRNRFKKISRLTLHFCFALPFSVILSVHPFLKFCP